MANGKKCGKICFFRHFIKGTQLTPFLYFYSRKSIKKYIVYVKIKMGSAESLYQTHKMEAKNWQKILIFSKILEKTGILEKNKIFENFCIQNFAIFRNSNWKFLLIYTFFNYGDTWNRLFGPFYPIYKLLAH